MLMVACVRFPLSGMSTDGDGFEWGYPELAEHFTKEQWHPKGCWVVDMIMGKS